MAVTVAMTLPILLIAMGWALDFGHVFVNKTRLQNALDATALSAAIAVNGDVTHNIAAATAKGIATFNLFKAATGNNELANLTAGSLVFDYSKTLNPWGVFNPATDKFAFVRVTSTNMLNVTPVFIKIFSQFNKDITVPAIATAGPVGTGYCNIMPFFLCATIGAPCNATECYGYKKGEISSLGQLNSSNYNAGNYGLLQSTTGNGANQIKLDLQGRAVSSCSQNRASQTGIATGPVTQGLNYRIDTLDINHNDYLTQANYDYLESVKPNKDFKALINPSITSTAYSDYKTANIYNTNVMPRVIPVAFADCTGMKNGNNPVVPLVGNGCVFITQHVLGSPETVYVEYINSCEQSGIFDPSHASLDGGYKIVLFKSPVSGDS
jgi:Flp pilus assembly protein TadG